MTTRRGVSLVEMLTLMSSCTVILTMSAVLIHRTMRAQEQTRYFFAVERAALRLAEQFRRDVHGARSAATDADAGDEGAFLRLEMPAGETVEYRSEEASVLRIVRRDGGPAAREEYFLAEIRELSLQAEDSPRRLTLTIRAGADEPVPARGKRAASIREQPIGFQVVATLSRDLRFAAENAAREDSP
jgi:hypothetical protein